MARVERRPPPAEGVHRHRGVGREGQIHVRAGRHGVHGGDPRDHQGGRQGPSAVEATLPRPAVDHHPEERREEEEGGAGRRLPDPCAHRGAQEHRPDRLQLHAERVVAGDVVRDLDPAARRDIGLGEREVVEERVFGGGRGQRGDQGQRLSGHDQRERGRSRGAGERVRTRASAQQGGGHEREAGEQRDHRYRHAVEIDGAQKEPDERPRGRTEQREVRDLRDPVLARRSVRESREAPGECCTQTVPGQPDQAGERGARQRRQEPRQAPDRSMGERRGERRDQLGQTPDVVTTVPQEGDRQEEPPRARAGNHADLPGPGSHARSTGRDPSLRGQDVALLQIARAQSRVALGGIAVAAAARQQDLDQIARAERLLGLGIGGRAPVDQHLPGQRRAGRRRSPGRGSACDRRGRSRWPARRSARGRRSPGRARRASGRRRPSRRGAPCARSGAARATR